MGDRVCIVFKASDRFSPIVYLHWGGEDSLEMLQAASNLGLFRSGDEDGNAARLCGYMWSQGHDVGVFDSPSHPFDYNKLSHGDAGFIVVDCSRGETHIGGKSVPMSFSCHEGYWNDTKNSERVAAVKLVSHANELRAQQRKGR